MKVILDHNLPQEKAIPCAEKIFKDLSVKYVSKKLKVTKSFFHSELGV
ncbi:MAG: hypothetical protein K8R54_12655 [Bacteroidales bacterium]|nr:hypothetical protein [Bacteroidales bacterium]